MFRVCSGYVLSVFKVCSECNQSVLRVCPPCVLSVFNIEVISSPSASSVSIFGIFNTAKKIKPRKHLIVWIVAFLFSMGKASWKTSCTSTSLSFVSVKFHGLHFMFNTWQVAALSTLDGPSSPCHAPESALGYYTMCNPSSFHFFQTLVSTSLT